MKRYDCGTAYMLCSTWVPGDYCLYVDVQKMRRRLLIKVLRERCALRRYTSAVQSTYRDGEREYKFSIWCNDTANKIEALK